MSLQGFMPVFTVDEVIKTPPMITEGFNLDYDGDSVVARLTLKITNITTGEIKNLTTNIMDLVDATVDFAD